MSESICIFGSCLSRDLLELDLTGRKTFELNEYIARQSIAAALEKPIEYRKEEIQLPSKFQRGLVYNDLEKTTFSRLKQSNSKYCMIDLIDERFALGYIEESLLTLSMEVVRSGYMEGKKFEMCDRIECEEGQNKKYYIRNKSLDHYMELFIRELLKCFEEKNIILHKVGFKNQYWDSSHNLCEFEPKMIQQNNKLNAILTYMYPYFEDALPNSIVLDCWNQYFADEKHKWGLAPMHYEIEYYKTALGQLYQAIKKD